MLVPADVAEQPYYDCRIAPVVSKSLHPNFPNVHAGKLTETQRPSTKIIQKLFKNPLRGQSDRAAEFPHPHRAPGANGAELLIEGKTVTL